ncbi:hypothetical protein, partial [Hydrotalea sp. AMD]|uniref:hypothetical protein n=1 Tax=Hydrotalea sp. AMD TaxID=2501297 RepID=UPI00257E6981
ITMRPKDGGAEITTATPYNNIPKNVDAVLAELEDLDEIMSSYQFGETYNIESITYIVRIRK